MSPLLQALYEYVNTYRMNPKGIDPEYCSACGCADRHEERLRALLNEEGRQILRDMLSELALSHAIEQEAMFCAALVLGRELANL